MSTSKTLRVEKFGKPKNMSNARLQKLGQAQAEREMAAASHSQQAVRDSKGTSYRL